MTLKRKIEQLERHFVEPNQPSAPELTATERLALFKALLKQARTDPGVRQRAAEACEILARGATRLGDHSFAAQLLREVRVACSAPVGVRPQRGLQRRVAR